MHRQASGIRFAPAIHALIAVSLALLAAACKSGGLPPPGSEEYRQTVTAFYVGLAGLQTGEDVRAREKLTLTTQLAPGEPAGWANLGLLSLRQQELDAAYELLEKARTLAPGNSQIESLLGLLETKRGKQAEAVAHLRKAVELDQKNLRAVYALAQELERQGGDENEAEALRLIEQIVAAEPENTTALLELTRLAAKRGEGEKVKRAVERITPKAASWPAEVQRPFAALQTAATGSNPRQAATQVAFLRNALARVPDYRQSLEQIRTPAEFVGEPFTKFLKLPSPSPSPAPADTAMTFGEAQPVPGVPEGKWDWVEAVSLDSESSPAIVVANKDEILIGGKAKISLSGGHGIILPFDFNYDFKTDFLVQSGDRLRLYKQESLSSFVEVPLQLPDGTHRAPYVTARTIDVDLDGDLDVWLSPARQNPNVHTTPIVLRNNGNGTFEILSPFKIGYDENVTDPDGRPLAMWQADMVSADVDGDGDPDVAMISDGGASGSWRLRVFSNERLGQYRERQVPKEIGDVRSLNAADLSGDGMIDFIVVRPDGKILRLSDKGDAQSWEVKELATLPLSDESGSYRMWQRLLIADLDNNGALDLIVEGSELLQAERRYRRDIRILLNDGHENFTLLQPLKEYGRLSLLDLNGDGKLDLVGLALVELGMERNFPSSPPADVKLVQLTNRGTKNYHHQIIRPRAAKATGDQRINSFGIGGEIEIRAGLLTQKQVITSPLLHFGLGEQTQTDVARIVWPNGSVQAEFELMADQAVLAEQRLKGSCPMLFAWDGKQMSFVKDAPPWSPALGLHINAQFVPQVQQTEEWFKIPGRQLVPRDGFYDLRITAELWEVYYIDHYSLAVVDHPADTEIFTDERFAVPEPPLSIYATAKPAPLIEAKDDQGQDVTDVVRELDGRYLDTFGRGAYQGVTRDHWVEVLLPGAAKDSRQWLVAHGWLHPTDGSINIALTQNQPSPRGLSLEVQDERGNWVVAKPSLGFPAGKNKTVMIDLTGVFKGQGARRLRLRTNMEIYWDKLEYAASLPEGTYKAQRVALAGAELRYRGFSEVSQANESSPEVFDYNRLRGTAPRWRDMVGYYTRHGDVNELLKGFDDRYVIVGAGDELRLKFAEVAPPPAGWVRDYVIVGNGWIKDGDLNSTFSKTVLPLPSRATKDYNVPPRALEDDPVYQRHKEDWQTYHTRYVTPERFLRALRP
jgi:tetratricopeptide (TPR) repeat protein